MLTFNEFVLSVERAGMVKLPPQTMGLEIMFTVCALVPAMAKMLYEHIENKSELNSYVDIKRFKNFASSFYQNE